MQGVVEAVGPALHGALQAPAVGCRSQNAGDAAQVPAYFALILRAFSVIEGIALRVDPSYSIVKVALPGCSSLP